MTPRTSEPLAGLFDAVLALALQRLIAANPELLLPTDELPTPISRRLRRARDIVVLARELHLALERYRDLASPASTDDDDIPF